MSNLKLPKIVKARSLQGKSIIMRDANIKDAEFILSLRTDQIKARFLSNTDSDVEKQRVWLKNYSNQTDQAYFIIENFEQEPLGTVRLYDAQDTSFCWGSWIIKHNAPSVVAIESALMVYVYSLNYLGFDNAHFDVRKNNDSVWKFHERFGAVKTNETDLDYIYTIDKLNILKSIKKYNKFLPNNILQVNHYA